MKTYYDLTNEEMKKYRGEFKKTPVGSKMNSDFNIIRFFFTLVIIADILTLMFIDEDKIFSEINEVTNIAFWFLFAVEFVFATYLNINFSMWLKNKHDIKRW